MLATPLRRCHPKSRVIMNHGICRWAAVFVAGSEPRLFLFCPATGSIPLETDTRRDPTAAVESGCYGEGVNFALGRNFCGPNPEKLRTEVASSACKLGLTFAIAHISVYFCRTMALSRHWNRMQTILSEQNVRRPSSKEEALYQVRVCALRASRLKVFTNSSTFAW